MIPVVCIRSTTCLAYTSRSASITAWISSATVFTGRLIEMVSGKRIGGPVWPAHQDGWSEFLEDARKS